MTDVSLLGTLLALAFAMYMLRDEVKRFLLTIADVRIVMMASTPTIRKFLWRRYISPARPILSVASILLWMSIIFFIICRIAGCIMAAA